VIPFGRAQLANPLGERSKRRHVPPSTPHRARKCKNAMPFIPIPNTAEVEIRGSLGGALIENTLYFTNAGTITFEALNTLAFNVGDWFGVNMLPLLSADYTLREVFARDLTTDSGVTASAPQPEGSVGGQAGGSEAGNVSACISFRTGFAGRSFRGRNYIPAIPKSQISQSILNGSWMASCITAYQQLSSETAEGGWTWVVASRYHNNAPRVEGVTTPVNAVLFTDVVSDSQRRRLPGRGA